MTVETSSRPGPSQGNPGREDLRYAYHVGGDWIHRDGNDHEGHGHAAAALRHRYGPSEPSDRPGYGHRHAILPRVVPAAAAAIDDEDPPCRHCDRPFAGYHVFLDYVRSRDVGTGTAVTYGHRLVCRTFLDALPDYDPIP